MNSSEDQQFCLRWSNFQTNITSQFETLREDEDFTDVTIACDGQQLQAHKIILSACSPLFKELLKSNPCRHPIIFMRDVEAQHIEALMEFMYVGEVNIAQAQLSSFLKTAEALKIRGLTNTSTNSLPPEGLEESGGSSSNCTTKQRLNKADITSCSSIVTSSQDVDPLHSSPPPPFKRCKNESTESLFINENHTIQPKHEVIEYFSDEEGKEDGSSNFNSIGDVSEHGGMESVQQAQYVSREGSADNQGTDNRKLHSLDPRPCEECGRIYSNLSNLRQHMKLVHYPRHVSCPICKKTLKTDLYLKRHMLSYHGHYRNHKNNKCTDDNNSFVNTDSYNSSSCQEENVSILNC